MRRFSVWLLLLFTFAVPWEHSLDLGPGVGNVARVVGILLLIAAVFEVLCEGGWRRPGPMQWLVLVFYLYFVASYGWTVDQESTVDKMRAYFQVMMTVWLVWQTAQTASDLRGLLRAFVAGCWVLAGLTFVDFASGATAAQQIRFAAGGQDPNDVARFLDLGFPFAALLFAVEEHWMTRLLAILYVPAGLLAVLLTASRGGFTGALGALMGSAMLLVRWRPRAASVVFVGLGITAGALWILAPGESLDRLATIPEQLGSGDWNDRVSIWAAGLQAFNRSPWWGSGAGTFPMAAGLSAGDTAHNTVMAVLVTGGLVGMAIFTAILVSVVWAVAMTRGLLRVALATVLAVWAITSMVGSVEENRTTWLIFALLGLAARIQGEAPRAIAEMLGGREAVRLKMLAVRPWLVED